MIDNWDVFADLGIEVPKTWAEFEANNEKIKAAGIPPVLATYADAWTAQLFVADYFNVNAQDPEFTEQYTNNEAKYATTPAALTGFQRLAEGAEKEESAPARLPVDHSRRRTRHARGGPGRPISDAQCGCPGHRSRQSGRGGEDRLLRPAELQCRHQWSHALAADAMYIAKNSEHKDAAKEFLRGSRSSRAPST